MRFLIFVFLLFLQSQAYAQSESDDPPASDAPQMDKFDAAAAQTLSALTEDKRARVIIEFVIPSEFDNAMAADADKALRKSAVEAGRTSLLNSSQMLSIPASRRSDGVRRVYDYAPYVVFEGSRTELEELSRSINVKRIIADTFDRSTLLQSTALIGMPSVWASGNEGTGQAVAILDTGVQTDHPFFGDRVIAEVCYSTKGVFFDQSFGNVFVTSLCPNNEDAQIGEGSGVNCNVNAGCFHGTHVAGIAAGNEGSTSDGVARGAPIIAAQVFSLVQNPIVCGDEPSPCIRTFTSDQLSALDHLLSLSSTIDIAAVNMSFGGGDESEPCTNDVRAITINSLTAAGTAVIASAGNDSLTSGIGSPACIPSVISVGSTRDTIDTVSNFSNSASFLDLLAPGERITSSVPTNNFGITQGTSMAAPHVAGAFSVLKAAHPDLSVAELLSALVDTGVPITDTRNNITKPRIAVDAALASLDGSDSVVFFPLRNGYMVIPTTSP